jgi:tripartite-type tricarboxylate transporter receptor subunit TctC
VVGIAAGGGTDILARLFGQWLSDRLGQPFVIENRPGGGGNLGTEAVSKAVPDGHTLLVANTANAINATLYSNLNFDFLRDITPVAAFSREPLVMVVNPSFPAKTVPTFIAHAKLHPDKVNMASPGVGSGVHLAGELFNMMAGVAMTHVPYRGSAPALTDLIGGQVQVMFSSLPSSIAYIRAAKLRPLAVSTADRSAALPDIPTLGEFLPGYEASSWYGLTAPSGTSGEIIDKLNREVNAAFADAKFRARFSALGSTALPGSPAEFGRMIVDETQKWAKVIRAANIRAS